MNWKIIRDPFYSDLYEKHGRAFIDDAGFFEDTATENVNIEETMFVPCTPYNFLLEKLKIANNPCVLLSTGSFCPVHDGHIDMMVNAYYKVESMGFDVVGGYMSPGHDEYINEKTKEQAIPVHERISILNDKLKTYDKHDVDWLAIDPWEGVFCKTAVNFTDVIERLKMYLFAKTGRDVRVFFVCGGDNARFAQTFKYDGNCIVVNRPGYEDRYDKYHKLLKGCGNIIWANGVSDLSSTVIRNNVVNKSHEKKQLILRMTENQDPRMNKLLKLLKPHFSYIRKITDKPDMTVTNEIDPTSISTLYDNINFPSNTISLDSQYISKYNLEISRYYDCFGIKQLGYGARPESDDIETQLSKIGKGHFYLYDDDIHTGGTMRYARELLEKNGNRSILGELCTTASNLDSMEILDERDFYIGHENGGLVIATEDGPIRVPYVYPYVCPYVRASISDPMAFSIAVWQLNLEYWSNDRLHDPDNNMYYEICLINLKYLKSLI